MHATAVYLPSYMSGQQNTREQLTTLKAGLPLWPFAMLFSLQPGHIVQESSKRKGF